MSPFVFSQKRGFMRLTNRAFQFAGFPEAERGKGSQFFYLLPEGVIVHLVRMNVDLTPSDTIRHNLQVHNVFIYLVYKYAI
jgi:hypothetical protein